MIDIARLILELRPDLCRRFAFHLSKKADAYLAWLLTNGALEYAAVRGAPGLLAEAQASGYVFHYRQFDMPKRKVKLEGCPRINLLAKICQIG